MNDLSAGKAGTTNTPFLTDVATLRARAREHIDQGAVTSDYGLDRAQVCWREALKVFESLDAPEAAEVRALLTPSTVG